MSVAYETSFCYLLCHVISSCDVLLTTVAGLKLLRTSFCDPSFHFLTLLFTLVFFHFDCPHASESFLLDFFIMSIIFPKVRKKKVWACVKQKIERCILVYLKSNCDFLFATRCVSCS